MIRNPAYRVYVATAGVFLGAGIVSLSQRLLSVGLADLRGALGLGFDEAAWIPTASNMCQMFMGPFSVYLGALLGVRRVLLTAAPIYAAASFLLPFSDSYPAILTLQVIIGLSSGTFYPLSLSYALAKLPPKYVVYAIGAYSMEILVTLSLATPLEAWFMEHASYRWIFWAGPLLALAMTLAIYSAIPNAAPPAGPKPRLSFRAFLYASVGLSLVYGTLEQGERLDWLGSGTIVAMLASGGFLLLAAAVRRAIAPNPVMNLRFLLDRNTLILGLGLSTVRFLLLAMVFLVPGFLGSVQGYRALETGHVLTQACVPLLLAGALATLLMRRIDARIVSATGLLLVGASALLNSSLTSAWVDQDFQASQILLASGLAFALAAEIGLIGQQVPASGALGSPLNVLTLAAFFQTVRLFGGQFGTVLMQRFVAQRELFHSNRLGYNLQVGDFLGDERLRALSAGVLSASQGIEEAQARAAGLLGAQVRQQAYTVAYSDAFILVALVCLGFMLVLPLMKPLKVYSASPTQSA
jgi:DHA2 family multidrug resistance protein